MIKITSNLYQFPTSHFCKPAYLFFQAAFKTFTAWLRKQTIFLFLIILLISLRFFSSFTEALQLHDFDNV